MSTRYIPYRTTGSREAQSKSLVEKGSTDALRIDRDEIERTISMLRDNHQVLLKDITTAPHKHLEAEVSKLRKWAKSLLGLETYTDFYRLIIRHFGDLKSTEPGTIGSFCYGCNSVPGGGGVSAGGCTPTCLGSIPAPDMPGWVTCQSNVSILYRDKQGVYRWKDMQSMGDQTTYIFLIDDTPDSPIDYNVITTKGIKKFSLYEMKNGTYKHIKTDNAPSAEKMSRMSHPGRPGSNGDDRRMRWSDSGKIVPADESVRDLYRKEARRNKGHGFAFLILFVLFLVVVIIAGGYYAANGRKKKSRKD